jgi:hypothetical protein
MANYESGTKKAAAIDPGHGRKPVSVDLSWFPGPEGRQTLATPARAWAVDRGAIEPRSGERFPDESFAAPWLIRPRKRIPTAHAVGYTLTALRASARANLNTNG